MKDKIFTLRFVDYAPFSVKEFVEKYIQVKNGEKKSEEIITTDGRKLIIDSIGIKNEKGNYSVTFDKISSWNKI